MCQLFVQTLCQSDEQNKYRSSDHQNENVFGEAKSFCLVKTRIGISDN